VDIIHERTMVGLAAAKARAAPAAAPTVMDANKLAAAGTRRARGESPAKIAKAFGQPRLDLPAPGR